MKVEPAFNLQCCGGGRGRRRDASNRCLRRRKQPGQRGQGAADRTRRERELLVRGQTDPGSRVEVDGVTITPDAQGHFERKVSLREGRNTVDVRAVGVGRIEQRDKQDVVVDTTPPPLKTDTQDIWNQANDASP